MPPILLAFVLVISTAGHVTGPQGKPVAGARIEILDDQGVSISAAQSDNAGAFTLSIDTPGSYVIVVQAPGFAAFRKTLSVSERAALDLRMDLSSRQESLTVTADVKDSDILFPDPAQRRRPTRRAC